MSHDLGTPIEATPARSVLTPLAIALALAGCSTTPARHDALAARPMPATESGLERASDAGARNEANFPELTPSPLALQESGFVPEWCFALSVGYTCIDSSSGDFSQNDVDETDTGFAGSVAYRPLRWVSAELCYQDLGQETYIDRSTPGFVFDGKVDTTAYGLSAVGHYPLSELGLGGFWARVEALARLGVLKWEAEDKGVTVGAGSYSESDDGTDLTYGLGARVVLLDHLSARLEWNAIDDIDFSNWWLGFLWSL